MSITQSDITYESRKDRIVNHIRSHQGCTKADIVRELYGDMAKKTIDRLVDELIEERVVIPERISQDRRKIKLYIQEDNPLVYVPQQLKEIEIVFIKILHNSEKYMHHLQQEIDDDDWVVFLDDVEFDSRINLIFDSLDGSPLLYFAPTVILRLIIDCITIYGTTIWTHKFSDESDTNKLLTCIFMKLSSLNIHYVDYLKNIHYGGLIQSAQFDSAAFNRFLFPIQLMYGGRKLYRKIGMEKEIEEIFDLLWKFSKDILHLLFPEIRLYEWNFNYGSDNWRNILEIYENNPDQTAHNYYREQMK